MSPELLRLFRTQASTNQKLLLQTLKLEMGSSFWAWRSGSPLTIAGSFMSWATSRLHIDWTTRVFQQDEEMLVLTQSDELNRTYCEDTSSLDDTRRNTCFLTGNSSLQMMGDDASSKGKQSAGTAKSSSTGIQQRPVFQDTETTSAGSSALPKRSQRNPKKQRHSKIPALGKKQKSYRLASRPTELKQGISKVEGKDEKDLDDHQNVSLKNKKANIGLVALAESLDARTTGRNPPPTISTWEAGWNVTNAIQGVFVMGLPFALLQSGYAGLVLLVVSAWVCNHTGKTLVACLYEDEQSGGFVSKVRVRHSYQDVMEVCFRKLCPNWVRMGGMMVIVAQVIELVMTCSAYLLVSTGLLLDSLSGVAAPRSVCLLVSLMCVLPCLLLTGLRPVSTLSLLCSLAHALISLLVILFCLSRANHWSLSALSVSVKPEDFLVSVGVIIFSYTSQIFLPPLEGSMEDRGHFNGMLGWTHGVACMTKTMFSLTAVLTWGPQTKEFITDNLPSNLRPVVNLCLLAKALMSFPLPFYSAATILQSCLLQTALSILPAPSDAAAPSVSIHDGRGALAIRCALLLMSYLLVLLVPRFSLLMGLTGSVTGAALTLILPCLFHLTLRWKQLTVRERLIDAAILSFGVICSVSGVIFSVKRLIGGL
ncbi:vesicular inhibitory amino acid transporter-like [Gouania willdenowi]|uniref:vesicular inhibitory amino acid transporter-like n=1 Tax=Gouania willdenowi TaxID=441366 RepID=UPI00105504DA|nr:vesicular inhibitory amino acid transporter-like [Gouania willdenowi]